MNNKSFVQLKEKDLLETSGGFALTVVAVAGVTIKELLIAAGVIVLGMGVSSCVGCAVADSEDAAAKARYRYESRVHMTPTPTPTPTPLPGIY